MVKVVLGPIRYRFVLGSLDVDMEARTRLSHETHRCLAETFELIENVGLEVDLSYVGDACFFEECGATVDIIRSPDLISVVRIVPV